MQTIRITITTSIPINIVVRNVLLKNRRRLKRREIKHCRNNFLTFLGEM